MSNWCSRGLVKELHLKHPYHLSTHLPSETTTSYKNEYQLSVLFDNCERNAHTLGFVLGVILGHAIESLTLLDDERSE